MQYKSVIYFLLNFAWYFIQLDIVQNLRNCWKIICFDMSPYYCTYEERKKLNELEIQQVYGRVTPFLKLQILMSSLQIQKTKYKGGEKCFSNHQSKSTKLLHYQKLAYSLHIMFAIVKKMIFLASFDVRLAHARASVVSFELVLCNFNFCLHKFKGLTTLKKHRIS